MIRVVPVVFALVIAGCAVPAAAPRDVSATTSAPPTTTPPTTTSTTLEVEAAQTVDPLLEPGVPIRRPLGFPSFEELEPMVETAPALHSPARITSGKLVVQAMDEYLAIGGDPELAGPITTSYFDDAYAEWQGAQARAIQLIALDLETVGYEIVAGEPTVHLRYAIGDASADLWVDHAGTALRIVEESGIIETDIRLITVWSVAELSGPGPLAAGI